MEDKAGAAVAVIKEALEKSTNPAAAPGCDMAGAVLVHMLRSAERPVTVLLPCDKPAGPERLKYIDKLVRVSGLKARAVLPYGEMQESALAGASAMDADLVITSWESGESSVRLVNLLKDFTEEDLTAYIESHGLPEYPHVEDTQDTDTASGDDTEVAEKLKSLGYM